MPLYSLVDSNVSADPPAPIFRVGAGDSRFLQNVDNCVVNLTVSYIRICYPEEEISRYLLYI
jgi:hypothetical protein